MLLSYAIAAASMLFMMVLWVIVQMAWRKTFLHGQPDVDVLAIRGGCAGCSCTGICQREQNGVAQRTGAQAGDPIRPDDFVDKINPN